MGIGHISTHSRVREARESACKQQSGGSSPGQGGNGRANTQGESPVILYDSGKKFISSSQRQEHDTGNHAQQALCAWLESLWRRFMLG